MTSKPEQTAEIVEIGIHDVDEEHKFQFRLLKSMQAAVDEANREHALALLQQLYSYSEAHFGTEQVFMRLHSYPAYHTHAREHGDLLAELNRMISSVIGGEAADLSDWPRMIRRWLVTHINSSDAAFGKWVQAEEQRSAHG